MDCDARSLLSTAFLTIVLNFVFPKPLSAMTRDMLPGEPAGPLSLDANKNSTRAARFLRKWTGQPDKQAAFTFPSEPVYLSEHSSINGTVDRDVKDSMHADIDDDDDLRKFYEPIATYEGRHRYDPKAQWTLQEEKKLVRRVCILICKYTIPLILTYFSLTTRYVPGCALCSSHCN